MMGTLMPEDVLFMTPVVLKERLNLWLEVYRLSC